MIWYYWCCFNYRSTPESPNGVASSQSLIDNDDDDDDDEYDEYDDDPDMTKFNEDGSFIGMYSEQIGDQGEENTATAADNAEQERLLTHPSNDSQVPAITMTSA